MADPIVTSEGGAIAVSAGPHGVYISLDLSAHDQVAPVGLTLSDSEVHDLIAELAQANLEYQNDTAHHEKHFAKGNNTRTDHPAASKAHKDPDEKPRKDDGQPDDPATSTVTLGDVQGKPKPKAAPKEADGSPGKSAGELEAKREHSKHETVTE